MITFLASLFIKDRRNYDSPAVRQAYGVLSGAVGNRTEYPAVSWKMDRRNAQRIDRDHGGCI